MGQGFSEGTVARAADAPEGREGGAEELLVRVRAVSGMWREEQFLSTIKDRLSIDPVREAARRLSVRNKNDYWRRAAREDAAAVARALDLETTEAILTLPEKELKKVKFLNVVLEGCALRITWEEARLVRIANAIEATELLEKQLGKNWRDTHRALAYALGNKYGEYADAVTYVSKDVVTRALAVSKEVNLPITDLLKSEDYSQYNLALSIEDAEAPSSAVMSKTTKESAAATAFTESISRQTKRPVVYICNARGGTLFGYTVDSIDAQLARQIKDGAQIDLFWKEVRNKIDHRINEEDRQNTAVLHVADRWMKEGRIQDLVIPVMSMKIPSTYSYRGRADERLLNPVAKAAIGLGSPIVFADTSRRNRPRSSERLEEIIQTHAAQYQFKHIRGAKKDGLKGIDLTKPFIISINPTTGDRNSDAWWDDNPHFLGYRADRYTSEHERRDTLVVEVGGYLVFISEKIENTIKLLDVDSKNRNWFQRNFEGYLTSGSEKPKPGSARYLELYRAWVPFETTATGEAVLDKEGYVVIRANATFADNTHRDYLLGRAAMRSVLQSA